MTTALATRASAPVAMRTDNLDTLTVARMLAESGFFGEVRDAGKALAKILAGQELGMGPIASLMGVYYQQGKVTYSANIMAAAVKKTGQYSYRVKTIGTAGCSIEFLERAGAGWSPIGVSEFTIKDAEQAGLTTGPNKHNWKNYPRNMLFARAMSNGVKWFTPDIFGGITPYTPDELGGEVVISDDGEMRPVIEDVPVTPLRPVPVDDAGPAPWVATYHAQWAKGAGKAKEIGADIPDKLDAEKGKAACQDALGQLKANIDARQDLIDTLSEVVQATQDAGSDAYEVPGDIATMSDAEIRDLIATAQKALAAVEDQEDLPL